MFEVYGNDGFEGSEHLWTDSLDLGIGFQHQDTLRTGLPQHRPAPCSGRHIVAMPYSALTNLEGKDSEPDRCLSTNFAVG